ncbi:MAG TPA: hypothetical protein ENI96_08005 [Sedimenticola thiotaurini]|uniref:Tetratricopeptide repeat protein n=1 Tax=Sedimenticola thiotaurini TaxID=1543721 RepID=A0A831RNT5_9GAMM|nr:hypothetical protein [Sedimenticola thiotaurini]
MGLARVLLAPVGWLFRHLFLLTCLAFVLIGYAYRGAIFGIQRLEAGGPAAVDQVALPVASPTPEAGPAVGVPAPKEAPKEYRFRPLEEPPAESPGKETTRLTQAARRAYWNDDLAAAEELYRQLLRLAPDDPGGYGELGNVRYQRGDLKGAVAAYRRAIELLRGKEPERARQLEEILRAVEAGRRDGGQAPATGGAAAE